MAVTYKTRRLFVDPSSHSTGWALFQGKKYILSGTIQSNNKNKFDRLFDIYRQYSQIRYILFDEVHIECIPIAFNRKQAFNMKPLMYSIGAIVTALWMTDAIFYDDIYPQSWQSYVNWNKTKHRTGKREKLKKYKDKVASEDELAAIGMGIYYVNEGYKNG